MTMLMHPFLDRALELAARWHDGTYRKLAWRPAPSGDATPGVPVIAHTTMVGMLLQRAGWDEVTVAAGFLHDILEDPNRAGIRMSYEALCAYIGKQVADLVQWVTEPRPPDTNEPLAPWKERKQAYLHQLAQAPDEAVAISLADKLHNLWTITEALKAGHELFGKESRFSAGPREQQWFFQEVLRIARVRTHPGITHLQDELEHTLETFNRSVA